MEVSADFKKLDDYGKSVSPDIIGARIEKYGYKINLLEDQMTDAWEYDDYYVVGYNDGIVDQYMGVVPNDHSDMVDVEDQRDPEAIP